VPENATTFLQRACAELIGAKKIDCRKKCGTEGKKSENSSMKNPRAGKEGVGGEGMRSYSSCGAKKIRRRLESREKGKGGA